MSRKFRIFLPYFMVFFCSLFASSCLYNGRYVFAAIHLFLALFWLWQFVKVTRFFRLKDEFDNIMAETKKRIDSGAPAGELIEMAKNRLDMMK